MDKNGQIGESEPNKTEPNRIESKQTKFTEYDQNGHNGPNRNEVDQIGPTWT